jgi:hypothetical protein
MVGIIMLDRVSVIHGGHYEYQRCERNPWRELWSQTVWTKSVEGITKSNGLSAIYEGIMKSNGVSPILEGPYKVKQFERNL